MCTDRTATDSVIIGLLHNSPLTSVACEKKKLLYKLKVIKSVHVGANHLLLTSLKSTFKWLC